MRNIIIKPGASLSGLKIQMRPVLMCADDVWAEYGRPLVVTSGTDGAHSPGSMHYYGYALDFRTRYFSGPKEVSQIVRKLRDKLATVSCGYTVLAHSTHIHVHFKTTEILNGK